MPLSAIRDLAFLLHEVQRRVQRVQQAADRLAGDYHPPAEREAVNVVVSEGHTAQAWRNLSDDLVAASEALGDAGAALEEMLSAPDEALTTAAAPSEAAIVAALADGGIGGAAS